MVAAGTFACLLSAGALAQNSNQWVDVKNAQELRAIYSNKTFHPVGDSRATIYYRADGQGLVVWTNKRFPRTWEVKGQQVCLTDAGGTSCFKVQRNKTNPSVILARDVKTHAMAAFNVEDGVPDF